MGYFILRCIRNGGKPQQIMGFKITHLDWCGLKQDIKTNANGYILLAYFQILRVNFEHITLCSNSYRAATIWIEFNSDFPQDI